MSKSELYQEIGRKVVQIARQAEIVSFAAKAKKGAGKKSQNCTAGKSHSCTRPDGSSYCISLNRKCRMAASATVKKAAEFVGGKVKQKRVKIQTQANGLINVSKEAFDLFTGGSSLYTPKNIEKLAPSFSPFILLSFENIAKYGDGRMKNKWKGKGVSYHGFDASVTQELTQDVMRLIDDRRKKGLPL